MANSDKAYKALTPAGWIYFNDPMMVNEYRNMYGYQVTSNNSYDDDDDEYYEEYDEEEDEIDWDYDYELFGD